MSSPKPERFSPKPTPNAIIPQHAKGCSWQSWGGAFAISDKLHVFEATTTIPINEIGTAAHLTARSRAALADHMIGLWTRFKNGEVVD